MKGDIHILPENDIAPHVEDRSCWCRPVVVDGAIVVHNSADGRELDEMEAERLTKDWPARHGE